MVCFVLLTFVFVCWKHSFLFRKITGELLTGAEGRRKSWKGFVRNFFSDAEHRQCNTEVQETSDPGEGLLSRPHTKSNCIYFEDWQLWKRGIKHPWHGDWWSHESYSRNNKNKATSASFEGRWLRSKADLVGMDENDRSLRWQSGILTCEPTWRTNMRTRLND